MLIAFVRAHWRILASVALAALVGVVAAAGPDQPDDASAATNLYPNLQPFPAFDVRIEISGSTRNLRFSTRSWNSGQGPVELIAGPADPQTQKQIVYQRIFADDGSHSDVYAGTFVWHQAHNHFHFERYADYILTPVGSSIAGSGSKTTFCVMDTDAIDLGLPGAPGSAEYTVCGNVRQGMSVGWADTYGYYLAGQEINVTGFPAGDYQLAIVIDPANSLVESNDSDNSSVILLRVNPAAGTVQVLPDSDSDGVQNSEDNCPAWPNTSQSSPAWPVPSGDSDCDGFTDVSEASLGTVATSHCPSHPSDDAWPPDLSISGSVGVTDVLLLKPGFAQTVPPALARHDLVSSASIGVADVLALKPYFGLSCN